VDPKKWLNQYIGNNIYNLRTDAGMTQRELGQMLGITDGAVVRWEKGQQHPHLPKLYELAKLFGKDISEIIPPHLPKATR